MQNNDRMMKLKEMMTKKEMMNEMTKEAMKE